MEIRTIRPGEVEAARSLLVAAGWVRKVADGDDFRELRAGRNGVAGFYEKLGFARSGVAMERPGELTPAAGIDSPPIG